MEKLDKSIKENMGYVFDWFKWHHTHREQVTVIYSVCSVCEYKKKAFLDNIAGRFYIDRKCCCSNSVNAVAEITEDVFVSYLILRDDHRYLVKKIPTPTSKLEFGSHVEYTLISTDHKQFPYQILKDTEIICLVNEKKIANKILKSLNNQDDVDVVL